MSETSNSQNEHLLPGRPSDGAPRELAALPPAAPAPVANVQFVRLKPAARPPAAAEQGMSAGFVLKAIRQWCWLAVPMGLLLAIAGAGVVYLLFEPKYEAAALLRIEERQHVLSFDGRSEERSKAFFQTQVELIRQIAINDVLKDPKIARIPEIEKQPDPAAWLSKQVKVAAVGESELFRILYASPSADDAAKLVNAITGAYFKLRTQSEAERNQRVIEWLEREKKNRSEDVERLRANLFKLVKELPGKYAVGGKTASEAAPKRTLSEVQSRLVTAQVERAVLEARLKAGEEELKAATQDEAAAEKPDQPLLSKHEAASRDAAVERAIEEHAEVKQLKALILAKQTRLADIEARTLLGKADPAYRQRATEIERDEKSLADLHATMRPRLVKEIEVALVAKRADMETAQAARRLDELAKLRSDLGGRRILEKMLQEQYDREVTEAQTESSSAKDQLELQFEFKRDELARAEKVFEMIAQKTLQLQTEQGAPARISLLRPAEPPQAPLEAFPLRNMLLAALAGLSLPFLLAVVWERIVRRVSNSEQLEQQSHLTVLGEIARLPARTRLSQGMDADNLGQDLRIFEESIDSLRTSLTLADDLQHLRILAVTSAVNHEGKTSLSAQLAVSMARASGEPVLLIDGDMRSPDIHKVFQIPLQPGLVEVLARESSLEEAIVTSWSPKVHLLSAGRLRSSPHQLLGNGAWQSLLAQIPATYRYVIIDTPPVLAASEALVLSKAADASLVCAMRDVSRVDQVRKACERLAAAGGNPLGTVLSGVPTRQYAYRYGSYAYIHD
jgi:polysaccharide biosynthesis transport protein